MVRCSFKISEKPYSFVRRKMLCGPGPVQFASTTQTLFAVSDARISAAFALTQVQPTFRSAPVTTTKRGDAGPLRKTLSTNLFSAALAGPPSVRSVQRGVATDFTRALAN